MARLGRRRVTAGRQERETGREPLLGASERIQWVTAIAADELRHASEKFPAFNSPHEGLAVIWEEFEELKQHVWENTGSSVEAAMEAIQIAAMALRYVHDLGADWGPPPSPAPVRVAHGGQE